MGKTIKVLGTKIKIKEVKLNGEVLQSKNDGLYKPFSQEIFINKELNEKYKKKVARHEIVHAFFSESGLDTNYSEDELLVDWIALQFPKMLKVMKEYL